MYITYNVSLEWRVTTVCDILLSVIDVPEKFGVDAHPLVHYIHSKLRVGGRLLQIGTNNLEFTPIYHFRVCISIQLQHKLSSTHQWHKQRGGRIHQYKSPLCRTLALKGGGGEGRVYSRVGL